MDPPFWSIPPIIIETPFGRTPPYWVNWCAWSARCFATVATSTGSSYVILVPCEKNLALSTSTLASGMYPAAATPMCLSTWNIFWVTFLVCSVLGFSSTAITTPSFVQTPTASAPLFTVSMAYSTWYMRPSGEYIVDVMS